MNDPNQIAMRLNKIKNGFNSLFYTIQSIAEDLTNLEQMIISLITENQRLMRELEKNSGKVKKK